MSPTLNFFPVFQNFFFFFFMRSKTAIFIRNRNDDILTASNIVEQSKSISVIRQGIVPTCAKQEQAFALWWSCS
jgi:hypothetical protein